MNSSRSNLLLFPFLLLIAFRLRRVQGSAETLIEEAMEELNVWLNSDASEKYRHLLSVECPPPYFRVMSECFYVHTNHHLSWTQARTFCQGMAGDLAQPRHLNALLAVVAEKYKSGPSHLWLGASDLETEGTFRWLSGDLVTSGWRENQPDDAEGDEDCLEMWTAKFPSLSDKQCHLNSAFICQCIGIHQHRP
ncbi:collectin-11 isoform X2 [Penaeus vannamei]|uniref:collectin-11 isoform X2 n=1 Tax=Penaeus vannamei TaxID=6689 RepID=UPI000F664566|nr:collectin-11-like isoform X2 [Penaeus vannamei]